MILSCTHSSLIQFLFIFMPELYLESFQYIHTVSYSHDCVEQYVYPLNIAVLLNHLACLNVEACLSEEVSLVPSNVRTLCSGLAHQVELRFYRKFTRCG